MVAIDFCFACNADTLCLVGRANPRKLPELSISSELSEVSAPSIHFHDFNGIHPPNRGFLAVFHQENAFSKSAEWSVGRANKPDMQAIASLSDNTELFCRKAKDGVLNHVLHMIATGALPEPSQRLRESLLGRLDRAVNSRSEFPEAALCMQRTLFNPASGQGLVTGWHLGAIGDAERPALLAISAEATAPVRLLPNSIARKDLEKYKDKYGFSGRDGFCGSFNLRAEDTTAVIITTVLRIADRYRRVARRATPSDPTSLGLQALKIRSQIGHEEGIRKFEEALLPPPLPHYARAEKAKQPQQPQRTLLLVDHDGPDPDVRDAIRAFMDDAPEGSYRVQLLRQSASEEVLQAMSGALLEWPDVDTELLETQLMPDPKLIADWATHVVFAKSSALIQSANLGYTFHRAEQSGIAAAVVAPAPIPKPQDKAPEVDSLLADPVSFVAVFHADELASVLQHIPASMATFEGHVQAALRVLEKTNALAVHTGMPKAFFEGRAPKSAFLPVDMPRLAARDLELLRIASDTPH